MASLSFVGNNKHNRSCQIVSFKATACAMSGQVANLAVQKMKRFRARRGLSQEAFAPMVPVSRVQVSRWESGSQVPRRAIMERLRLLDVCHPGDWFMPPFNDCVPNPDGKRD